MVDIELISTDELITELSNRHKELIVIREHKKIKDSDNIFVKTPFGELGKKNKGFDLVVATEMLQAALRQLTIDFLKEDDNAIN